MKKLIRNIILLLLPILLYYGVFLGFVGSVGLPKAIPGATPVATLGQYRAQPTTSVILGDSRMAHFDMDAVERITGRPFTNLAFGGASLNECLDELEWLLARYPQLDEVVFGFTFYNMNQSYDQDRFSAIETSLYNPFALLTNLSYNLELLQNLVISLGGGVLGGGETETRDPASYTYVDYTDPATGETVALRQDIVDYMDSIGGYTQSWQPDTEAFARLLEIINTCHARGIRFVVVMPPMHSAVLQHEVRPTGIEAQMLPMVEDLKQSPAEVLDYELTNRPAFTDDQFFDGLHLDYQRGLPQWTEMLFSAIA
ncbi:MAG: hypothetical protein GXY32_08375 [Ruminococcaceae bacterium]|nr:hypothetical protein [Oscillospiraceae bacterium]